MLYCNLQLILNKSSEKATYPLDSTGNVLLFLRPAPSYRSATNILLSFSISAVKSGVNNAQRIASSLQLCSLLSDAEEPYLGCKM